MKKVMILLILIILALFISACTDKSTVAPDNKTKDKPKVGFTEKDVQEAVNDGLIVIEQTSDDDNAFYNHEPDAIKVYNLEKIFAFEDNVDEKGGKSELKITTFMKRFPPITDILSYDGKLIHYKSSAGFHQYTCELLSTFDSGGTATLYRCTDENGKKVPDMSVVNDNKKHFDSVKEEYKGKLKKNEIK